MCYKACLFLCGSDNVQWKLAHSILGEEHNNNILLMLRVVNFLQASYPSSENIFPKVSSYVIVLFPTFCLTVACSTAYRLWYPVTKDWFYQTAV